MDALLYLVHRIPYPPDKGDKIRSYHWLRFLAERYRVYLGTFVDADEDWQHVPALERICEEVCAVPLDPTRQSIRSLAALVTGEPMSLPYYRSRELHEWARTKIEASGVSRVVVFSSPMAQYVPSHGRALKAIVDFVDVDSQKWRDYGARHRWPKSWLYRREGEKLSEFERDTASDAAASVFVTDEEAGLFRRMAPMVSTPVHSVKNGVDAEYFDPDGSYENPYLRYDVDGPVVVFTGLMDYWANVDAVEWFVRESFPKVQKLRPRVSFFIVGGRPSASVMRLGSRPGVVVTGRVDDVRPYLAWADAAVAPLRVARGIQNKVLEAFSMGLPVVATRAAVEGLVLPPALFERVTDDPGIMAKKLNEVVSNRALGAEGRAFVLAWHDWRRTLEPVADLIERAQRSDHVAGS